MNVKEMEISRTLLGEEIRASLLVLGQGIRISVFGGSRPHIGAVSVADGNGENTTKQFPGHKDGAVSERWAKALSEAGYRPVVVDAGIHYDHLGAEGIRAVLELSESMLQELLQLLRHGDGEDGL